MGASTPEMRDWFRVNNAVAGIAHDHDVNGWHPWLVTSTWQGPRITLLLRSTTRREGRRHDRHSGSCCSATCVLDEQGWISDNKIAYVDDGKLTDFSCVEPDDAVVEWAMRATTPPRPKRRGRR